LPNNKPEKGGTKAREVRRRMRGGGRMEEDRADMEEVMQGTHEQGFFSAAAGEAERRRSRTGVWKGNNM
jgi:hypothetical protein